MCGLAENELAAQYNAQLRDLLTELNGNLPGAQLVLANVYDLVLEVLTNYEKYMLSMQQCCYLLVPYLIPHCLIVYSSHWQSSLFLIDTEHTIIVVAMEGDMKVLSVRTNLDRACAMIFKRMCFGIHIIQVRQQMFFANFYHVHVIDLYILFALYALVASSACMFLQFASINRSCNGDVKFELFSWFSNSFR